MMSDRGETAPLLFRTSGQLQDHGGTSSVTFFTEAPDTFITVAELVHRVSGYLPDKQSVLRAASVSKKWRHAVMWDGFAEDLEKISKGTYRRTSTIQAYPHMRSITYDALDDHTELRMTLNMEPERRCFLGMIWVWWLALIPVVLCLGLWLVTKSLAQHTALFKAAVVWNSLCVASTLTMVGRAASKRAKFSLGRSFVLMLLLLVCFLMGTMMNDLERIMLLSSGGDDRNSNPNNNINNNSSTSNAISEPFAMTKLLSDSRPWGNAVVGDSSNESSSMTLAQRTDLIQLDNPSRWRRIRDLTLWIEEPYKDCQYLTFCCPNHRNCPATRCCDAPWSESLPQWQNVGPFDRAPSDTSSTQAPSDAQSVEASCANPQKDAFPHRTLMIDLTSSVRSIRFDDHPTPAPHGVETVDLVLFNVNSTEWWYGNWSFDFYPMVPSKSSIEEAKWRSILFYNTPFSENRNPTLPTNYTTTTEGRKPDQKAEHPVEREMPSVCNRSHLLCRTMSPDELASMLQQDPFNLSPSYLNSSVFAAGNKSTLRYWLARVSVHQRSLSEESSSSSKFSSAPSTSVEDNHAADDENEATVFAQEPQERLVVSGDDVHPYTSVIYHVKIEKMWRAQKTLPNRYYAPSTNPSTWTALSTVQYWSIHVLPSPSNCSYPTLTQNPHGGKIDPSKQSPGALLYAGPKSYFWFKSPQKNLNNSATYFDVAPLAPVIESTSLLPGWCKTHQDARSFFMVWIFLISAFALIQVPFTIEPYWAATKLRKENEACIRFKQHENQWWSDRQR